MVKRMPLDDRRVHRHLAQLAEWLRENPPHFLESTSYLPEAFFAYGFDDEALYWLRRVIDSRWTYPEIPFTIISNLATGLTGLEVAADGSISTRSKLPDGEWVEVRDVPIANALLTIRHEGRHHTELTLAGTASPLRCEAHFAGTPPQVTELAPGSTVRLSADRSIRR